MFKKNCRHYPLPLTSNVDELPKKLRKHLSGLGYSTRKYFFDQVELLLQFCTQIVPQGQASPIWNPKLVLFICAAILGVLSSLSPVLMTVWDLPFADPLGGNRADFLSAKEGAFASTNKFQIGTF